MSSLGPINQTTRERIEEAREAERAEGEPLDIQSRKVVRKLRVNITDYAARTHGIDVGEAVSILTYRDRIVIIPDGGELAND